MKKLTVLLNFIIMFNFVSPVRILCIYPVPFDSHQSVFQVLTEELAKKGHELVVLTPLPHSKPLKNVTEIDVHNVSYTMWEKGYNDVMKNYDSFIIDPITLWDKVAYGVVYSILETQYNSPEMKKIIQDETQHFDLILAEGCMRPSLIASARFKAPAIIVSSYYGSADAFYTVGASIDPILFPESNIQRVWKLSFWEKLYNLYIGGRLRLMEWQIEEKENAMIKRLFGEDAPTMQELKKNVEMILLNVHPIWDNNRPVPPSVMYMGALHLKTPKPLPQELKKYLDNSINGVIYMSLGSKIRSSDLPPRTLQILTKVFESLPYNVLWKWDGDKLPTTSKNIRFEKWLPQNDLLHHPKLKGFITQAGLQSTDEAITANVPVIGLPVFADQFMNAQKYQQFQIGFQFDIDNLDEKQFKKAVIAIATDESYRRNIASLSRIMEKQRAGAVERALDWVQFIATNGPVHLRSPLAELSFTEYYVLDVIIPVTLALIIVVASIVYLAYYLFKRLNIYFTNVTKLKTH